MQQRGHKPYGIADTEIIDSIRLLARTEGLIADSVYEGRFEKEENILLMHLGGSPTIHAYAEQFGAIELQPFNI